MRTLLLKQTLFSVVCVLASACNNLVGLDSFGPAATDGNASSIGASCDSNAECRAGAATGDTTAISVCVKPEHRCVQLTTQDCDVVTGDPADDTAILIGSLFSTKGAQAATNLPRQQSAALAIEEINRAGGVPGASGSRPRPLVLVSCDESVNLLRAGNHLANELHVPAIIGPNTSQDTIQLSNQVTTPAGTLILTAILAAGLRLVAFEEHRSVPWDAFGAAGAHDDNGEYFLRERPDRMPASYTLQAIKL